MAVISSIRQNQIANLCMGLTKGQTTSKLCDRTLYELSFNMLQILANASSTSDNFSSEYGAFIKLKNVSLIVTKYDHNNGVEEICNTVCPLQTVSL